MKILRQIILVLAAGMAVATAHAQDKYVSHQGTQTNSVAGSPFSLELQPAPVIKWGANLELTGLAVDILRPQETGNLFDLAVPPVVLEKPVHQVPVALAPPPRLSDDQAAHTANFAVLRISFP